MVRFLKRAFTDDYFYDRFARAVYGAKAAVRTVLRNLSVIFHIVSCALSYEKKETSVHYAKDATMTTILIQRYNLKFLLIFTTLHHFIN